MHGISRYLPGEIWSCGDSKNESRKGWIILQNLRRFRKKMYVEVLIPHCWKVPDQVQSEDHSFQIHKHKHLVRTSSRFRAWRGQIFCRNKVQSCRFSTGLIWQAFPPYRPCLMTWQTPNLCNATLDSVNLYSV